jgi:hypothetical protein
VGGEAAERVVVRGARALRRLVCSAGSVCNQSQLVPAASGGVTAERVPAPWGRRGVAIATDFCGQRMRWGLRTGITGDSGSIELSGRAGSMCCAPDAVLGGTRSRATNRPPYTVMRHWRVGK